MIKIRIGRREIRKNDRIYSITTWGGDAGNVKSFLSACAYFIFGLAHGAHRPLVFPFATYCFCPVHLIIDNFQRIKIKYNMFVKQKNCRG